MRVRFDRNPRPRRTRVPPDAAGTATGPSGVHGDSNRVRVVKFGGSSLAGSGRFEAAVDHIAALRASGVRPVVVTSALGGTTDRLLELARRTGADRSPRELDAILATGETAAAALFAGSLEGRGIAARSVAAATLGLHTDDRHGAATIRAFDPSRLTRTLDDGIVPIVAGFQGVGPDGATTTLGRGGSDTTAIACAVALGEAFGLGIECDLLTDVPGLHTRDPNLERRLGLESSKRSRSAPRTIACLSTREMLALSRAGSRLVAPAAARLAETHDVPVRIASAAAPHPGTRIDSHLELASNEFAIAVGTNRVAVRRDAEIERPEHRATLRASLDRALGPSSWQWTDGGPAGPTLLIPEELGPQILERLRRIESKSESPSTWTTSPLAATITVVAGGEHLFSRLPEPKARIGPRTPVWHVPRRPDSPTSSTIDAIALFEMVDRWHDLLANAPSTQESAGERTSAAVVEAVPTPHRIESIGDRAGDPGFTDSPASTATDSFPPGRSRSHAT